ncbi:DUF6221 family protein [Promicromonospora iranensis]|uniref:Uncharacterized protein n=1 Tax=Promicromonospora iranensis TaxID=1105144 RepID=A0ABU2CK34_9MICO|nr:DUF6221 family protein [Promicromonospora iranensis]MDR7381696.1 hypothetical protein [Promicromonospora iranensis]
MIITEFLLARVAEDEAAAQAALDDAPDSSLWRARVLAECTAKRTIVEAFEELGKFLTQSDNGDGDVATGARDMFAGLMIAVQAHAGVYADHPDYRPAWRPQV